MNNGNPYVVAYIAAIESARGAYFVFYDAEGRELRRHELRRTTPSHSAEFTNYRSTLLAIEDAVLYLIAENFSGNVVIATSLKNIGASAWKLWAKTDCWVTTTGAPPKSEDVWRRLAELDKSLPFSIEYRSATAEKPFFRKARILAEKYLADGGAIWELYLPDGSILPISEGASQALQEV